MTQAADPLVSIVMPVYNGMPFLPDALWSALNQDYKRLEVVVINNGSTDSTTDFLRHLKDARLRLITRSETQSAVANWTQAVLEARGAFIKLMCADDVLEPITITRQVASLAANPTAGMAASRRAVMNGAGAIVKKRHGLNGLQGLLRGADGVRACLRAGTNLFGEPVCVLFRADLIKAAMPWEGRWPYMIDLATYCKVLHYADVVCEREVLASFRISATSWSASLLEEQPGQFRSWRDVFVASGQMEWTALDQLRSEANLEIRTLVRRLFFTRERRRTALPQ